MDAGGFPAGTASLRFVDRCLRVLAIFLVIFFLYLLGSGKLAVLISSCFPLGGGRGGELSSSRVTAGFRHSTGSFSNSRIHLGAGQFDFQAQHSSFPPSVFADQWLEEQLRQGATAFALPQQFQILEAMNIQKIAAVQTSDGVVRLLFSRRNSDQGSSSSQIEFNLNEMAKMTGSDLARGDFGAVNTANFGEVSELLLGTCKVAWESPQENGGRNLLFATEVSGMLPEAALEEAGRRLRGGGFQTMSPNLAQASLPRALIAFREQRHCQVQATEYQGKTTLLYRFE